MKFYFSLKIIKEKQQVAKNIFKRNRKILHRQEMEIKKLKQIATFIYNYSSSQTVELHPSLRASKGHSTLQLYQLFPSLLRQGGSISEKMNSWLAIPSLFCLSFAVKRKPYISLFYVDDLSFEGTDYT